MKKCMRTQKHLAKKTACTLLLCAVLTCTACGTDTEDVPGKDTPYEANNDGNESQQAPDSSVDTEDSGHTNQAADSAGPENAAEISSPETDTAVSILESNIKIEMKNEEEEKTAENGTVYLTRSWTYPVISIEGNDAAAEKINADIRSRVDSFRANTEVEEWAKEGYEYKTEELPDDTFLSYSEDLSFAAQRADSNVISFTESFYAYTGGAHGNSDTRGVNYNAKTGELISFTDLSDDSAAFHEDTLAYNQKLAETASYQERMFSSESITDGSLEAVLYADDVWYLSTSGLVFMSAPYALGPYAAGTIEFIIPYSDLANMGFKDSYAYTDRLVMKLQESETYNFDLNGDGQEDSVLFHSESTESEDGNYSSILHLTVNDTDFSQSGSDAVKEYLSTFSWGEFLLYDINVDDNYTELVVLFGENEGDDYVYYSHFFRYTKDGDLIYLGKARGDVNDPTLTFSIEE